MPKVKEKTAKAKETKKEEKSNDGAIIKGDMVKVHYKGSFEDGTVFDSSEERGTPLEFQSGAKQLIKGFDDAVIGMKKGEEKNIKIIPSEAYGDHNPDLIKKVPRERLPAEPEPKAGMMLILTSPQGMQLPAKIMEVSDKEITIDLNHPLAGKTLNFSIKVVDVTKGKDCCDHKDDCCSCH